MGLIGFKLDLLVEVGTLHCGLTGFLCSLVKLDLLIEQLIELSDLGPRLILVVPAHHGGSRGVC